MLVNLFYFDEIWKKRGDSRTYISMNAWLESCKIYIFANFIYYTFGWWLLLLYTIFFVASTSPAKCYSRIWLCSCLFSKETLWFACEKLFLEFLDNNDNFGREVWPNGWVFVYELSGSGFESSWSHLTFRSRACFEQGVPWHSDKYIVWIHSETRTWHDKNIQSMMIITIIIIIMIIIITIIMMITMTILTKNKNIDDGNINFCSC